MTDVTQRLIDTGTAQTPVDVVSAPVVNPASNAGAVAPAAGAAATSATSVSSAWGQTIPYLFGTVQALGQPLWTGPETLITNADGTSSVQVNFAVIFGRPSARSVSAVLKKMYFDGTLIYDTAGDAIAQDPGFSLQFYDATQTAPDGTIDAVTTPNTPAFLGMLYAVFTGYIIPAGSKFPQVQAVISVLQDNAPSGARIQPYARSNPHTYYENDSSFAWDYGSKTLFCRQRFTGVANSGNNIFDIYDTDAQEYIRSVTIDTSMAVARDGGGVVYAVGDVGTIALSQIDLAMYWLSSAGVPNGHHQIMCSDTTTGQLIGTVGVTAFVVLMKCFKFKGNDILVVSDLFGGIHIYKRVGNTFSLIIEQQISNGAPGPFCGAYSLMTDYTATGLATREYMLFYFLGPDGDNGNTSTLFRVIITATGGPVIVAQGTVAGVNGPGVARIKRATGITKLGTIPGAVILNIGKGGKRIYAITSDGALKQVNTYYYYSSDTNIPVPVPDGVTLTYDTVVLHSSRSVPPAASSAQQLMVDPGFFAVAYGTLTQLVIVNFLTGAVHTYNRGNWLDLPAVGNVDYGLQQFVDRLIFDAANSSMLYCSMESPPANNVPGRAFYHLASQQATASYVVADAFKDLSILAGLPDVIVQDLSTDTIRGMIINTAVKYTDLISQLAATFRVDVVETPDFNITFKRSVAPASILTLLPVNMVPINNSPDDGHVVTTKLTAADELPNMLQVEYIDPDYGYVVGVQTQKRPIYPYKPSSAKTIVMLSIPIVMTAAQAAYWAAYALYDMWAGNIEFTVNVSAQFYAYECGDYVTLQQISGKRNLCKITAMQYNNDTTMTLTLSSIVSKRSVPLKQIAPVA